jgi:putative membrane protein
MAHKTKLIAAVVLLAVVIGARADDKKPANQPFNDAEFVKLAATDGMHEVALGKIAENRAKSDAVKQFGEQLVKDHMKANENLKSAAKAANIPVPDKIDAQHQKEIDFFKNYKGTNFDKDFLQHEVKDHTQAVALFTQASKEAKHKEIKDFATTTLPVLQKHLETAKKLNK